MKVLKFGGSSVASGQRLDVVAKIAASALLDGPIVVVVSALAGVTDRLEEALADARAGRPFADLIRDLRGRHLKGLEDDIELAEIVDCHLDRLDRDLQGIALLETIPERALHRVLATGERLSAPRIAAWLRLAGISARAVDGRELLQLEAASIDRLDRSRSKERVEIRLLDSLTRGEVPVVTGFIAADHLGETVTLGRGGSDLSATMLGGLLDARQVEIYTDTDGVLCADPARVDGVRRLDHLSLEAADALARHGAKVLHPSSLAPARREDMPVRVRSSFEPLAQGTRLGSGASLDARGPATAVTSTQVERLTLAHGSLDRALRWLERLAIRPLELSMAGESLDLILRRDDADSICQGLDCDVICRDRLATVALLEGRSSAPLLMAAAVRALEEAAIQVIDCFRERLSESSMVVVLVHSEQEWKALRELHRALVQPALPQLSVMSEAVGSLR